MHELDAQLDWEYEMVYRGISRYRKQQDEAKDGDRAHETSAGSRIMKGYVLQISEHIRAYLAGELGRRSPYHKLMHGVSPDAIAMFTLRSVVSSMYNTTKGSALPLVRIAAQIGIKIEDEIRFGQFNTEHKEYYDTIMRGFQTRNTTSYRHMHNSLVHLAGDKGMEWQEWSQEDRIKVGSLSIKLLMDSCDLVEITKRYKKTNKFKPANTVVATAECLEWIAKHDKFTELTHPDRMPCLIEPAPWANPFDGGFWSARMRHNTPLVKRVQTTNGTRGQLISDAIMPGVLRAVNGLQATPWKVNAEVQAVMKVVWRQNLEIGMPRSEPYEIPKCPLHPNQKASELPDGPLKTIFNEWRGAAAELYAMEGDRQSKNRALIRTMRLAEEMRQHDKFYYVYQCDFRGRIYCATSGLSPQGTDQSKALLKFGRSEVLGERGMYWLKVHGANKYGYDKVSYDERVRWIDFNHELWMAIATDPITNRNGWKDADKPWQFLAFCFEYAAATEFGEGFRSSLPVALDGSCNGLQHFSAMLRDPVGGAAVNLTPSEVPADIYQQVADVATAKLRELTTQAGDQTGAHNWLRLFGEAGMPRKLSKKPVMTLPYGSTMNACTSSIFQWIHEFHPGFFDKNTDFRHALYLSPILWAAISEVVIAARVAMDWIQSQTKTITAADCPLQYNTALGFPVYQATKKFTTHSIFTQIGGTLKIRVATDTHQLDARKQRQGSAPNLIHSVDATHLMMVINAGLDEDMECFAMIHDDFGCHASRIDRWQEIIRETFVALHKPADILPNFKDAHEIATQTALDPLPELQTLEITDVLAATYFFG